MSTRLGVGLIGAGRMGRVHADILARELPGIRLVAVADADHVTATDVGEQVGAKAYLDHRDLLADPAVRAVVVATPTDTHPEVVLDAAAAGVHVFCEKPLALTVAETHRVSEGATQRGIRLQVGLYRRFDNDYRRARERIREGAIGRPQFIRALQYDTFVPPAAFCAPASSGGIAVDMGIHEFDIMAWLIDDAISEVYALGTNNVRPELAEVGDVDTLVASLRFASGALGSVELIRDVGYAEDVRTEVVGTAGSVTIGALPASHSLMATGGVLEADLAPSVSSRFRPALVAQLRSFCRAIMEDTPVEVSGADTIAALAAGIAARASLEERRPTRV